MAIFEQGAEPANWQPTELARGPFSGLQGGAIAGLLSGEIERLASERSWGFAVSASIWFLRPVPMASLRTEISVVRAGGRISLVDNALFCVGDDQPCALARVTLAQPRPIEIAGYQAPKPKLVDPLIYPSSERTAPHGGPWFMDAMEARTASGISWFRLKYEVIADAGPLAQVLGPADWAHGISRPVSGVVADPNSNLQVNLVRQPQGKWIGVEPLTHWQPDLGGGMGGGLLRDVCGVIGRVSMSVALTPFPK
ncbi:MAG: acyl-CoA thioesterase domain-containing protein [Novosphingobium sp.]|uniref:acyl-CoA thioesterase domain-containing protein n=1 Tax=Novosphingobium sp. TaxID=1874826 RepID=UPI0032B9D518